MKQVFLFDEVSRAAVYGIGSYIREVIHSLHAHYQINVVVYYADKDCFTIVEKETHRVIYIPRHQQNYAEGKIDERFFINSVYLLHDLIHPEAEELIFHFNHFRYPAVIDLLREYWPKSKMVLTVHYLYWCFTIEGNTLYFKEIIRKDKTDITNTIEREVYSIHQNEKDFLQKMDRIICLCNYTKEILENEYAIPTDRISLYYNGLKNDSQILTIEERKTEKKKLNLPVDSRIILFVGRLEPIKGLEYLIRAFKQLLNNKKNCYLIVAGDGEYADYLKECEEVRPYIIFTGRLPKKQLYRYYQIADIGVMPSKHEQCSYVAMEMMMHGIPLIASDSTGLDEMVTDGLNGYKIKTIADKAKVNFDIDTCHALLEKMLVSDLTEMSQQARKRYEKRYTIEQMQEGLISVYNKI